MNINDVFCPVRYEISIMLIIPILLVIFLSGILSLRSSFL